MSELVSVDTTGFDFGMERLVYHCKIEPRKVVAKETGELIKTLVRVTPPGDPSQTRQRIAKTVSSKFQAASVAMTSNARGGFGGKSGNGATEWYGWNAQFLYGVAKDMDLRKADVAQLQGLLYRLTPKGRQTFPFTKSRRTQRVLLTRRVLANPATVKKLIAKLQGHVGRLKAGWLVSVRSGAIVLSGSNLPPGYVTRHMDRARGYFVNGLENVDHPQFTIANMAKGVDGKNVQRLAQTAVNIRGQAMVENARLIFMGKKLLSDYGLGKAFVVGS